MDEIWAVLEHSDATLHEQSGELLSELVDIAGRQPIPTVVCPVLLCSQEADFPDVGLLANLGVQQLYVLEHAQLVRYSTEGYVSALAWFIQQRMPVWWRQARRQMGVTGHHGLLHNYTSHLFQTA